MVRLPGPAGCLFQTPPVFTESAFQQAQRRVGGGAEAGGGDRRGGGEFGVAAADGLLQQVQQFGVLDAPVAEPACQRRVGRWGSRSLRSGQRVRAVSVVRRGRRSPGRLAGWRSASRWWPRR